MIDDRRNPVVRADREKFRFELIAGPDVDGNDVVGNAEFFQHDRDFPAVRRRRVMKVDHGIILMEAAAILARDAIAFQRCCGLVGRMADMAHKRSTRNDREAQMLFPTTIAGSLPKPEWLAEPNTLWAPWKSAPKASSRGSISSKAFWRRSTASTSPTRSKWESAKTATRRWCRRWWRHCG